LYLKIDSVEEGSGELSGKLGAFIVGYKGNPLKVVSNFSNDQRNDFWQRRIDLIGRTIAVMLKLEVSDKKRSSQLAFSCFYFSMQG